MVLQSPSKPKTSVRFRLPAPAFLLTMSMTACAPAHADIMQSITIHDVGGYHTRLMKEGTYQDTFTRLSEVVDANTVTLIDTMWIKRAGDTIDIAFDPSDYAMSPTASDYPVLVKDAKSKGLETEIIIQLFSTRDWNKTLSEQSIDDSVFWDSYFASQCELILKRARMAQALGVERLSIGYNNVYEIRVAVEYWQKLVQEVRKVYKGKLGYYAELDTSEMHSAFDATSHYQGEQARKKLFDQFDYIGFIVQDPVEPDFSRNLKRFARYDKPVVLMVTTPSVVQEVAHSRYIEPCVPCGSIAPTTDIDLQLQKQAYQIAIDAVNRFDFVQGLNSWGYHLRDDLFTTQEKNDSMYNKSANVRGKPAEDLISAWYKKWD